MRRMKLNLLMIMAITFVIACSHAIIDPIRLTPEVAGTLKNIQVLNPGDEIVIYKYGRRPVSGKEVASYKPVYYFSVPTSKYLQKLTIRNLKSSIPFNKRFHKALDLRFKYDKDLVGFEEGTRQYKVITIYKENQ